jgi:hypothetical protein
MRTIFTESERAVLRESASAVTFRTPTSLADAKSALRRVNKAIRKSEAERADAERSRYDLGVKVQDERLTELRAAKAHFEQWIKVHR